MDMASFLQGGDNSLRNIAAPFQQPQTPPQVHIAPMAPPRPVANFASPAPQAISSPQPSIPQAALNTPLNILNNSQDMQRYGDASGYKWYETNTGTQMPIVSPVQRSNYTWFIRNFAPITQKPAPYQYLPYKK